MQNPLHSQSRTSLTTNASQSSRIFRKRDHSISQQLLSSRSKSRNREELNSSSFSQFVAKQIKLDQNQVPQVAGSHENAETSKNSDRQDHQAHASSNQGLIGFQHGKTSLLDRADRYIHGKSVADLARHDKSRDQAEPVSNKEPNQRKRTPTPVKSRREIELPHSNSTLDSNSGSQVFEMELTIVSLQQKLKDEKKFGQKLQNQIQQIVLEKQKLREMFISADTQNKKLKQENLAKAQRIVSLEKAVSEGENSLSAAQSSLNKLKQTIKDNKLTELQAEARRLNKINEILNEQIRILESSNAKLSENIHNMSKEIEEMKKKGDVESFLRKQSMRQEYLFREIERLRGEQDSNCSGQKQQLVEGRLKEEEARNFELRQEVQKLLIRIYCLEHFKQKQMREIKSKADSEIKNLRVRYSRMLCELRQGKKIPDSSRSSKNSIEPSASSRSARKQQKPAQSTKGSVCECMKQNTAQAGHPLAGTRANSFSSRVLNCSACSQTSHGQILLELSPQ